MNSGKNGKIKIFDTTFPERWEYPNYTQYKQILERSLAPKMYIQKIGPVQSL